MNLLKSKTIVISALLFLLIPFLFAASIQNPDKIELQKRVPAVKPSLYQIAGNAEIQRVIIKFSEKNQVRLANGDLFSSTAKSVNQVNSIIADYSYSQVRRLFQQKSEQKLNRDKHAYELRSKSELADLNNYYALELSNPTSAVDLVNRLNALDNVEIAYIEPVYFPAGDIAPPTPDYASSQEYLTAAPNGIDAQFMDTIPGGRGQGITIVDIEGGWITSHEDLDKADSGFVLGLPYTDPSWTDHGTAVLGVMSGSDNAYGVTGIVPDANLGMVSIRTMSIAEAIYAAVDSLQAGDVILIEIQVPGPHYDYAIQPDQSGYVCVEYFQANFDAIKYAWAKGIIVVQAAGNGQENFDDIGIYGEVFDISYRNSHSLIVGAGFPPASGSDREIEVYSNYGQRVNLQGYGSGVYTTGYGDLFDGGGDENQYYTSGFSGTSSAAPIIAGAVASFQGYVKASFGTTLNADYILDLFTATGSPQQGLLTKLIGPRPDLEAAYNAFSAPPSLTTDIAYIDTVLQEGEIAFIDIWFYNGSSLNSNYFIYDRDTTAKMVIDNWLEISDQSGVVYPNDSLMLTITLDASVIEQRSDVYEGLIEVLWGHTAVLDSALLIPVYLEIPCQDSTFSAHSSTDSVLPVYNWVSAKDSGIKIDHNDYYNTNSAVIFDDGSAGPYPIGFSFPFYTTPYDSFYVGINGCLSFTDAELNIDGKYRDFSIPGSPFTTFFAPLYTDLVLDDALSPDAGIYYYLNPTEDTLVVEWYNLAHVTNSFDTTLNFEIILTSAGDVLYQYKSLGSNSVELYSLIGLSEFDCNAYGYINNADDTSKIVSATETLLFKNHLIFGQTGNIDGAGVIDIADMVYLVEFMFESGPLPIPYAAGDVDCSGSIDIGDLVYLVSYMFGGGPLPCSQWMHDGF